MIVVSASLKKSGSGWYFNMTNDVLVQAGFEDVRALRRRHGLESVLREDNCRINPNAVNLARLLAPPMHRRTFVVKTHAAPTTSLRLLMTLGRVRATYIYRDPRDVVLSALDHGRRVREKGARNVLADLHSVDEAIGYVTLLLDDWEAWTQMKHTLMVRYEDLIADAVGELNRLAAFLEVEVSSEALHRIAAAYEQNNQDDLARSRMHFNQGVVGRFRNQLSPTELERCAKQFGPYLGRMGYAV